MTGFFASVAGILGAAVGSFLNVVVHRVPRGQSLVRPPSACPACGGAIRPYDNIPVVSYIVLRGRCRWCGSRISARYPLVEAATAALWAGAVVRFGPAEEAVFVAVAGSVLLAVGAIDLEHRRIPNVIVVPATFGALGWVVGLGGATGDWGPAVRSAASGAGFFVLLLIIALVSGGMGFGDVKLAAFVGLVTGRFGVGVAAAAVLGAFIIGGVVALALVVSGRRGRKDALPFGPSMAAGALGALFLGEGPVRAWLGL